MYTHDYTLLMFSGGRFLTTPTAFTTMSLLSPSSTPCHSCDTHQQCRICGYSLHWFYINLIQCQMHIRIIILTFVLQVSCIVPDTSLTGKKATPSLPRTLLSQLQILNWYVCMHSYTYQPPTTLAWVSWATHTVSRSAPRASPVAHRTCGFSNCNLQSGGHLLELTGTWRTVHTQVEQWVPEYRLTSYPVPYAQECNQSTTKRQHSRVY